MQTLEAKLFPNHSWSCWCSHKQVEREDLDTQLLRVVSVRASRLGRTYSTQLRFCPKQEKGMAVVQLSKRQLRYQYCAANKLRASLSRCSNAVKNVLFRSFCTPMYASQLWWNFRKSCMQRLRVAYNFGCRALYNLPWRASVTSHQVQCNIPTFEVLLRK